MINKMKAYAMEKPGVMAAKSGSNSRNQGEIKFSCVC